VREQLGHGDDVAHARNILQHDGIGGEQRRSHRGERGIFCTADLYGAVQLAAAVNFEPVHVIYPDLSWDAGNL
jgi:hypothetical protein